MNVVVAALAAGVMIGGCARGAAGNAGETQPAATTSTTSTALPASGTSTAAAASPGDVVRRIPLPGAFVATTGFGAVWVTSPATHTVVKVSAAGIPVGRVVLAAAATETGTEAFVTTDKDSVWASDTAAGTVVRIDPRTLKVRAVVKVGDAPWGLDAGKDAVWVALHHGRAHGALARIESATNKVTTRIPLGAPTQGPGHVAVDGDDVWVGVDSDKTVVRVSARTYQVLATVPVPGGSCGGLDAIAGAAWVGSRICGSKVSRIDARSNAITAMREEPGLILGLAGDADSVWVVDKSGPGSSALLRLDPTTLEAVGSLELDTGAAGVTKGLGSVWVTGGDELIQIAPR
ncbi:MAG TPA: hypothetical protein VFT31_16010 [Kribbella sp.]|nr:hypothetical protein [Kribbella sp.]